MKNFNSYLATLEEKDREASKKRKIRELYLALISWNIFNGFKKVPANALLDQLTLINLYLTVRQLKTPDYDLNKDYNKMKELTTDQVKVIDKPSQQPGLTNEIVKYALKIGAVTAFVSWAVLMVGVLVAYFPASFSNKMLLIASIATAGAAAVAGISIACAYLLYKCYYSEAEPAQEVQEAQEKLSPNTSLSVSEFSPFAFFNNPDLMDIVRLERTEKMLTNQYSSGAVKVEALVELTALENKLNNLAM